MSNSSDIQEKGITPEHVLLGLIVIISAFMFVEARTFGGDTDIFPKFSAAITFIGASLLLFRNYLPEFMELFVTETGLDLASDIEEPDAEPPTEETPSRVGKARWFGETINNIQFTVVLSGLYILSGVLVGFVWTSPIFAIIYAIQFRLPWYILTTMAIVAYGLVYVFVSFFHAPLDEGILLMVSTWLV